MRHFFATKNESENMKELKLNETGRSMVEMLGVLAIIGVLSIGGLVGYKYAWAWYRANEVINEVKKRAIIVSQQKVLKNASSLDEFNTSILETYPTTLEAYPFEDTYFMINVAALEKDVCTRVVKADWTLPMAIFIGNTQTDSSSTCQQEDVTLSFVFDNDLTGNGTLIGDDIDQCSDEEPCQPQACTDCILGQCVENCSENEVCEESGCVCPANFYVKGGVCTPCPEHGTSVGPNATECECSGQYIWEDDTCRHCAYDVGVHVDEKTTAAFVNRCNSICGENEYYDYKGSLWDSWESRIGVCKTNALFLSEVGDDQLLKNYNTAKTNLKKDYLFNDDGLNHTAEEIRQKARSLAQNFVPGKTGDYSFQWEDAKAWCLSHGWDLANSTDITDENAAAIGILYRYNTNYAFWLKNQRYSGQCSFLRLNKGGCIGKHCMGWDNSNNSWEFWPLCKK